MGKRGERAPLFRRFTLADVPTILAPSTNPQQSSRRLWINTCGDAPCVAVVQEMIAEAMTIVEGYGYLQSELIQGADNMPWDVPSPYHPWTGDESVG